MNTTPLDKRVIEVTLNNSKVVPFRPLASKTGNIYHCTQSTKANGEKYFRRQYGQGVSNAVIGDDLPTSITVEGMTFTGVAGMTGDDTTPTAKRNPKVTFTGPLTLKDIDPENGEEIEVARAITFRVSKTANGFNVSGSINRPGGAGGAANLVDEL